MIENWGKPPFNIQLNLLLNRTQSDWVDAERGRMGMKLNEFIRYCLLQYQMSQEKNNGN